MKPPYIEYNHPKLSDLQISKCYLCDKSLSSPTNSDHVIPDGLFPPGAVHRPQLPVHKACNDGKTLLDERFIHRMQLATHISSPIANKEVIKFLNKVTAERADEYLIGKKVRNLKLAKTLTKGMQYKRDIVIGAQGLVQVDMGETHAQDLSKYAAKMTKGLFIRNVRGVVPKKPDIKLYDSQVMTAKQKRVMAETHQRLMNNAFRTNRHFSQAWNNYVAYFGIKADEENAGMIIVQFYNSYFIHALFRP